MSVDETVKSDNANKGSEDPEFLERLGRLMGVTGFISKSGRQYHHITEDIHLDELPGKSAKYRTSALVGLILGYVEGGHGPIASELLSRHRDSLDLTGHLGNLDEKLFAIYSANPNLCDGSTICDVLSDEHLRSLALSPLSISVRAHLISTLQERIKQGSKIELKEVYESVGLDALYDRNGLHNTEFPTPMDGIRYLSCAGRTDCLQKVVSDFLASPNPNDIELAHAALNLSMDGDERAKNSRKLFDTVLGMVGEKCPFGVDHYILTNIHNVGLDDKSVLDVYDRLAPHLDWFYVSCKDADVKRVWALRNVTKRPAEAYHALRSLPNESTIACQALLELIKKTGAECQTFEPTCADPAHLDAIYNQLPLNIRIRVAISYIWKGEPWKTRRDAALQDESREFFAEVEKAEKKNVRESLECAYSRWIEGHGSLEDPHIEAVRTAMIDREIRGYNSNRTIRAPAFNGDDERGWAQFAERVESDILPMDPVGVYFFDQVPPALSAMAQEKISKLPCTNLYQLFHAHHKEVPEWIRQGLLKECGLTAEQVRPYSEYLSAMKLGEEKKQ